MRWHHVRTPDGWEIRDENAALVATIHNPAHDREADARLLADAPRLRDAYEPDAAARRERLVRELVAWIASGFVSGQRARRFHAGVRRLAKLLGRNPGSVLAELQAEAHKRGAEEAS